MNTRQIHSIDDLKVGQFVTVGPAGSNQYLGIVEALSSKGDQGLARVYKYGTDPLQTSAWLALEFDCVFTADIDTDEDRQRIQDERNTEVRCVRGDSGSPVYLASQRHGYDPQSLSSVYGKDDQGDYLDRLQEDIDAAYEDHMEDLRSFNLEPDEEPEGDSVIMGPVYHLSFSAQPVGAAQVLHDAAQVLTERGKRYDNAGGAEEGSYPAVRRTAAMWSTYLGQYVSPSQVADLMTLHKLARESVDTNGGDHRTDAINYLAIGEDISRDDA